MAAGISFEVNTLHVCSKYIEKYSMKCTNSSIL